MNTDECTLEEAAKVAMVMGATKYFKMNDWYFFTTDEYLNLAEFNTGLFEIERNKHQWTIGYGALKGAKPQPITDLLEEEPNT
jgi:hypothetical protein